MSESVTRTINEENFELPQVAYGYATLATPEDISKETSGALCLLTNNGEPLLTGSGLSILTSEGRSGYTNPNLHRRIDNEAIIPAGTEYPFVVYDSEGIPYHQVATLAVWDRLHSTRTTQTFVHDEESEDCEIP